MTAIGHRPDDLRLRAAVRPPDWRNPDPPGVYDLVVIGGGTAGLVSAFVAAALGARTALVERGLLGGDCLVTGCVPSKALLASARAATHAREAGAFGVGVSGVEPRGGEILARMRRLRADVAEHDAAARLKAAGVDVHFGTARFTGRRSLEVDGVALAFRRCIIATGARAELPLIPGLTRNRCRTNETVFELEEIPARLLVIGGGPIGCELSQAFARLGSRVTLVQRADRLLPRDDPDASAIVAAALLRDGVDLRLGCEVASVAGGTDVTASADGPSGATDGGGSRATLRCGLGTEDVVECDAILVAAGRRGNADALGLAAAGVGMTDRGFIETDDFLRTSCPGILAAGDAAGRAQFTHAADAMARIAVQNALFPLRRRVSSLTIPWCTYTDPEVAHAGVSGEEARRLGLTTVSASLADVDRAILDGRTDGFARLHVGRGGRIHGATVVGPHAGETIAEATLVMRAGVSAGTLEDTVHCYPTHAEALRRAAAQWRRTRLKPWMPSIFRRLHRLLR